MRINYTWSIILVFFLLCRPAYSDIIHDNASIPTAAFYDGNITQNNSYTHCNLLPIRVSSKKTGCITAIDDSADRNVLRNADCLAAVVYFHDIRALSHRCKGRAITTWANQIAKMDWNTKDMVNPQAIVFVHDQHDPNCLGSPYRGCLMWKFKPMHLSLSNPLPPDSSVFLVRADDWQSLMENATSQHTTTDLNHVHIDLIAGILFHFG